MEIFANYDTEPSIVDVTYLGCMSLSQEEARWLRVACLNESCLLRSYELRSFKSTSSIGASHRTRVQTRRHPVFYTSLVVQSKLSSLPMANTI